MWTDRQTDMTVAFRYFANAPKKDKEIKIREYSEINRGIVRLLAAAAKT